MVSSPAATGTPSEAAILSSAIIGAGPARSFADRENRPKADTRRIGIELCLARCLGNGTTARFVFGRPGFLQTKKQTVELICPICNDQVENTAQLVKITHPNAQAVRSHERDNIPAPVREVPIVPDRRQVQTFGLHVARCDASLAKTGQNPRHRRVRLAKCIRGSLGLRCHANRYRRHVRHRLEATLTGYRDCRPQFLGHNRQRPDQKKTQKNTHFGLLSVASIQGFDGFDKQFLGRCFSEPSYCVSLAQSDENIGRHFATPGEE